MINKLLNKMYRFCMRLLGRQIYSQVENKFVNLNTVIWNDIVSTNNKEIIVDFTTLAPDNFYWVMKKALAHKEKSGCRVIALLYGKNGNACNNYKIMKSYHVDDVIFRDNMSYKCKLKAFSTTISVIVRYKNDIRGFINFKYDGNHIGDCIYDAIVRGDNSLVTVNRLKWRFFKIIYKGIKEAEFSRVIFLNPSVVEYLCPEYAYLKGITIRTAYNRGICVNLVSSGVDVVYCPQKNTDIYMTSLHLRHKYNVNTLKELFLSDYGLREKSEEYFFHRVCGVKDKFDSNNAYKKEELKPKEIYNFLGLNQKQKNVLVASHVFSDVCHASKQYIFLDYYDWLRYVLSVLNTRNDINVLLKMHPSRSSYGESEIAAKLAEEFDKVHVIPDEWSTKSLLEVSDVVLTSGGTIGLEAACLGVESSIVCDSYYNGFDVVPVFYDKAKYTEYLLSLGDKDKSICSQEWAKFVLYFCHNIMKEDTFFGKGIFPGDDFGEMVSKQYSVLIENIATMRDAQYMEWMNLCTLKQ